MIMPVDMKNYMEIMDGLKHPERWTIVFNPEVFDGFEKKTKK